jgi:hypothetical protein
VNVPGAAAKTEPGGEAKLSLNRRLDRHEPGSKPADINDLIWSPGNEGVKIQAAIGNSAA